MDRLRISLQVYCPGLSAQETTGLTRNLREDVLDVHVDSAELGIAGATPPGAKSGEVIAVGALIVALAPTVVESLMDVISSWLSRQPGDVEIEVDGRRFKGRVNKTQRDELVAAYLRRLDRKS